MTEVKRPWYEVEGVRIRAKVDHGSYADRPTVAFLLSKLSTSSGLDVPQLRASIDAFIEELKACFVPKPTQAIQEARRCRANLVKFLKIMDKEGLIERVV
jgi:hypothetical protein